MSPLGTVAISINSPPSSAITEHHLDTLPSGRLSGLAYTTPSKMKGSSLNFRRSNERLRKALQDYDSKRQRTSDGKDVGTNAKLDSCRPTGTLFL